MKNKTYRKKPSLRKSAKRRPRKEDDSPDPLWKLFQYFTRHLKVVNDSKIFAGVMVITLNMASKYVNIRLSKSMESYLKHTFSRNILVFAICWVGTRDILTSLIIMTIFVLLIDYFLNEESQMCILPEYFTDYHLEIMNEEQNKTDPQKTDPNKPKPDLPISNQRTFSPQSVASSVAATVTNIF